MFRDRDLPFRLIAAALPPRLGYALSRRATPLVGGERMRGIERVVTAHALEFLGDPVLAARGRQTVATVLVRVVMSLSSSMLDVRPG